MDLDDLFKRKPTSLVKAVREENIEAVRDLLRGGIAHPNSADHRGWTSLHEAAARNQLEIVKMLLEDERTNPEAAAHDGDLALNVAISCNASLEVVFYLAQHTPQFRQEEYASCLLFEAASKASPAVVEYIIGNTSVDIQGHKRYTISSPVLVALLRNNEKIVEVLLDACDNVNDLYDAEYCKRTIIFAIEADCTLPIIKMLIKKGAFLNLDQGWDGSSDVSNCRSALTYAISKGRIDIAFELLRHNVNVNIVSQNSIALALAVPTKQEELVKALLPITSLEVLESLCEKQQFNGIICSALSSYDEDIFTMLLNHNFSEPILEAPVCIRLYLSIPMLSYTHIGPLAFLLKEKMHLFGNETLSIMELLLSKGISIEPRKLSYVPPLVATLQAWSRNDDKGPPKKALKMLLELGANVDYQSRNILPDALLVAIGNLEALSMLLPYSQYTPCDIVRAGIKHSKDHLWTFVLGNMNTVDDYLELSQFCKGSGEMNRNYEELLHRFCLGVAPLAVLARRKIRRCLRTTTSSELLNIISKLEIPETLKCYLRFM